MGLVNGEFVNNITRINLKNQKITKEVLNTKETRKWIGGAGIALKMLYDEVPPEVKPLDPENKLFFCTGPLNGTKIPGSGIISVSTKGPVSGYLVDAQANGFFGARLRHLDIDTLIVEEISLEWVYIVIRSNEIEFHSAVDLLGKDHWETEQILKDRYPNPRISIMDIGPAGENQIVYSAIMSDYGHAAASNGPGCVMGNKKVKAIVLLPESNYVPAADPKVDTEIRDRFWDACRNSKKGASAILAGTFAYFPSMAPRSSIAIKNYSTEVWSMDVERCYPENIGENWEEEKLPCWACPIGHCARLTITKGREIGYVGEAPEFEAVSAWTTNIGADDLGTAVRLQNLCDGMGFDLKELTYTISLVMECFNEGLLTLEDTGGLDLTWGNVESVGRLIQDIAHRCNFGAKLCGGVKATAEMIGGEALNMAVYVGRGNAPHVINGRTHLPLWYDLALSDSSSFYTHPRFDPEIGNTEKFEPNDRSMLGKAASKSATKLMVRDMIGCCDFVGGSVMSVVVEALNGVCGWDMDLKEVLEAGERTRTLARAYNCLNGLTAKQEMAVSPRYARDPIDGPMFGKLVGIKNEKTFKDYYEYSGWDKETSKPLPETLRRLGLEYIIKDLWPEND